MSVTRPRQASPTEPESVCADARAARAAVDAGLESLRTIRRGLADATRRIEAAGRHADRHAVADHKRALAETWRTAMDAAGSEDARRDATASWLRDVSDANSRTRAAMRQLDAGRRDLAVLEAQMRGADLDAAALRIKAEMAESACAEARRRRAAADEGSADPDGRQRVAAAAADIHGVEMDAEEPPGTAGSVRPVDAPTVRLLLDGDPATHQALARELAEMSGQLPARYLLLLDSLVDELAAAALDAGELALDHAHPLWGQFTDDDARLVVRGLRDLGFRLDLHDGWFGGRAPTGSDLASALGFAGLDVRGLRGVPSTAELRDLPMSIRVRPHEHLRRWAPDLTLDQMTRALALRATGLGELWDEWGRVRPLLADGLPAPA